VLPIHLGKIRVHLVRHSIRVIIGLALLFAASMWSSARAQVSASISGFISDPSDAAVPSANVTATDTETGVSRTASSDGVGRYLIVALPVGLYALKVSKPGFQESTRTGIQLNVGQEANIDVRLEANAVKAAVTVSEDAPVVNTSTSDISGLVGAKESGIAQTSIPRI
jgi:Carboxypeptidase regulatory-like domain